MDLLLIKDKDQGNQSHSDLCCQGLYTICKGTMDEQLNFALKSTYSSPLRNT